MATKTSAKSKAVKVAQPETIKVEEKPVKKMPRKFENSDLIECKNGTHGKLYYESVRNRGVSYEWDEFGETQDIEFGELVIMRGSQRAFFEKNWLIIDDKDVLIALGVDKYYKNVLPTDDFDSVFSMSVEEMKEKIPAMSEGMKESIGIRAVQLIKSGEWDSMNGIKALSEILNVNLLDATED